MGTTPTCTTCNSEWVASAKSTALRAASSACSEPSVASRILVGKVLIVTLSFPVGPCRGICTDCIKTLVRHKGTEMAQRRFRSAMEAHHPSAGKVSSPKFSHHEGAYRPEPESSGAPANGRAALLGSALLGGLSHVLDGDATS